jgi:hypothetical protein
MLKAHRLTVRVDSVKYQVSGARDNVPSTYPSSPTHSPYYQFSR